MALTPPVTKVQTSHALTIRRNGAVIGAINGWNPTQSRDAQFVYEFQGGPGESTGGQGGNGAPFDLVPQNQSGQQVQITRYDLYTRRMKTAFGTADLTMLCNQNEPFDVEEVWKSPDGQNNYRRVYKGCWFTQMGQTFSADQNRTVMTSATLMYLYVEEVSG